MLEGLKVNLSLKCVQVIVLGVFVAAMVKLQQFNVISDPDKVHHRCRAAVQQLTAPVVTNQFVLAPRYDVSITSQLAKNI